MYVTTALETSVPLVPATRPAPGRPSSTVCASAGGRAGRRRPARRWTRPYGTWVVRRLRAVRGAAADAGMSTAEYAVGTVAACAFATVLYKVVTSSAVSSALGAMIKKALGAAV